MTEREPAPSAEDEPVPAPDEGPSDGDVDIDHTVAHSARMYDYLLGGTTNFAADRAAVHRAAAAVGGVDVARQAARVSRAYLRRVVRYLAGQAGMRQFLDIGTGIPYSDGTHADPQKVAPDARVVYVDNDPIVQAHAHTLVRSTPEGAAAYVGGDLREPDGILRACAGMLDLDRPVAVVCTAVLQMIPDEDEPFQALARLMAALAPGSQIALSHVTSDFAPKEIGEYGERIAGATQGGFQSRTLREIAGFLDGLDLVEPGLVAIEEWRPEPDDPAAPFPSSLYGAVGRKP